MKTQFRAGGGQRRFSGIGGFTFFVLVFAALLVPLGGCGSVPNLESPDCTAARGAVKEFYSYHFGNEMKFSPENLKLRARFLTADYAARLQNAPPANDVFTTGDTDYPKAFRIGKCEIAAPDKANVQILLFWKDDSRSEQREINAEIIKQNDKWLINNISR